MCALQMKPPKDDIINCFESLQKKVFTRTEIDTILSRNKENWRLSDSSTVHSFISFLLENTKLTACKFEFPGRNIYRYIWGETSVYDIVVSLRPLSYFTHYTAMFLNELTEQIPNTIYLNTEQSRKSQGEKNLEQSRIDAAFKRAVRVSKNIGQYQNKGVCLLNGMHTDGLGVIETFDPEGNKVPATNIERTLIDIVVRPMYSGGVYQVLNAYKQAKDKVSINRLSAILKKLDYTYPYHQAVGFYLEKAGYKKSAINLLRKFGIKYDFYLTYQMKETDYSEDWRLYFPKGF